MATLPGILFTAFEPSGDALAAPMIAELARIDPNRPIYALGGPRMAASGAQLIETTTDQAVMLAGAAAEVLHHRARIKRLARWMDEYELAAVVAVDSPAANWSICNLTRRRKPQAKIIHLAAPQLWAWGGWRISKLRRLTDGVLCLLPFEPAWFAVRGVKATFVGHPLMEGRGEQENRRAGEQELFSGRRSGDEAAHGSAQNVPSRLALLPGSRTGEVKANWPSILAAVQGVKRNHPQLEVKICAADDQRAALIRSLCRPSGGTGVSPIMDARSTVDLPEWMTLVVGDTSATLDWADMAVVVSGTATLQCVAHRLPMVTLYRINPWSWRLAGRFLVRTRTFTLPNLINESLGGGRLVPELVPYFGDVALLEREITTLLADESARHKQRDGFDRIIKAFQGRSFARDAAQALENTLTISI